MREKPNGYGTMQLGGQERPFHVGLNQSEVFCALRNRLTEQGRPMSLHAYGELFSLDSLGKNSLTAGDARDFVYSALVSGYEVDGLRVDFTPTQVGYWLDDADVDEATKPLHEMLLQTQKRWERQVERAKNGPAPAKKTGAKKEKPLPGPG